MADPKERKKGGFPLDLVIIMSLVVGLVGATIIAGRRGGKKAAGAAEDAPLPAHSGRMVLPEQMGYVEGAPILVNDRVHGLTVTPNDHIFVSAGFSIIEYDPTGKECQRIEVTTAARALDAQDGMLYLGSGDHIEVLDPATGTLTLWPEIGEKAFITSVAASAEGLFVGDAGNHRFIRYSLDGTLLGEIGATAPQGPALGLDVPSTYFDVATAPDGTFWAIEAGHFGLVHYDAQGVKLGRFGQGSNAIEDFGGCCNPTHVALAPGDIIVTVEKKPDLVKTYHGDGTFRNVVAGPKAFVSKTFIADVDTDSKGRVILLDPKAKSVRIFDPKS